MAKNQFLCLDCGRKSRRCLFRPGIYTYMIGKSIQPSSMINFAPEWMKNNYDDQKKKQCRRCPWCYSSQVLILAPLDLKNKQA